MGIAEQQNTRKVSEGERDAKIELAGAERGALEELGSALREDDVRQSDYMLAQRYTQLIRGACEVGEKRVFLPYEASGLGGVVQHLDKTYGPAGTGAVVQRRTGGGTADLLGGQAGSRGGGYRDDSLLD